MPIQQQLDAAAQRQRDEMEALLGKAKKSNPMKIKKIGHCCLVIETKGIRIMTDPGSFTTAQNEEKNIDMVIISHEHGDHFHVDSLKNILANNPNAKVITNSAVGKLLDVEGIAHDILEDGGSTTVHDILLEGFGEHHAVIYKELGQVQNTGYFIDGRLFYPGDAFTDPKKEIDILAFPIAGPWINISQAIEYVLAIKPKYAFPVHDGVLKIPTMSHPMLGSVLSQNNIEFVPFGDDEERDF